MTRTLPSAPHSTLPFHRSPCSRAGGSAGPARSGSRAQTRSTTSASPASSVPASTARRRYGSTRCSAYQTGQSSPVTLRIGASPMNASTGPPGGGAPNAGAPAACRPASSRPNRSAVSRPGRPSATRSSTSHAPSRPCRHGTGGAPASASQRSPAASARAASASSARFTTTVRPSSRTASASAPDSGRTPVTARPVSRDATAPGTSSPDAGDDTVIDGLLGFAVRPAARQPARRLHDAPSVRARRGRRARTAGGGRSRGTVKMRLRPVRARHAVGAM
ncbi:hypothetical protein SALBM217S_01119 [Streptomyces griseoloalbus]